MNRLLSRNQIEIVVSLVFMFFVVRSHKSIMFFFILQAYYRRACANMALGKFKLALKDFEAVRVGHYMYSAIINHFIQNMHKISSPMFDDRPDSHYRWNYN